VQKFTAEWQRIEHDNLKADIMRKINNAEFERVHKETHDALDQTELERRAEEAVVPKEGEEPLTEDDRSLLMKKTKLVSMTK